VSPINTVRLRYAQSLDWDGFSSSGFGEGSLVRWSRWSANTKATGILAAYPAVTHAATAEWSNSGAYQFNAREIAYATATWINGTGWSAFSSAKQADPMDWSGGLTIPAGGWVSNLNQYAHANWTRDSTLDPIEADITAYASMAIPFKGSGSSNIEPRMKLAGENFWRDEAYLRVTGQSDLVFDPALVKIEAARMGWSSTASFEADAYFIQPANADSWGVNATVAPLVSQKIRLTEAEWTSSLEWGAAAYLDYRPRATLLSSSVWLPPMPMMRLGGSLTLHEQTEWSAVGQLTQAVAAGWAVNTNIELQAVRKKIAQSDIDGTATVTAVSTRIRYMTADWDGTLTAVFYGGVLTKEPASIERTFIVPQQLRAFTAGTTGEIRLFEVAA
jgi:hypothetical protein